MDAADMKAMEKELLRIEAYNAASDLMARFSHLYARYQTDGIMALFSDRADTRVEMVWGVYNGPESIRRCFSFRNPLFTDRMGKNGEMHLRPTASDVIEVAEDGQTAKGVWFVPGLYAQKSRAGDGTEGGWYYAAFGVDFIFENGTWRIWHLHEYARFRSPYDVAWGDIPPFDPYRINGTTKEEYFALDDPAIPDAKPTTIWGYHPYVLYPIDQPTTPEAYDTFRPARAY